MNNPNQKNNEFLDVCKNEVTVGKCLPNQYVEQCYIALVEGEITHKEFFDRTKDYV